MENPAPALPVSQYQENALKHYLLDHTFDEMFADKDHLREQYAPLLEHFGTLPQDEVQRRKQAADLSFLNQGIDFIAF